jgi:hypothetical protein
MESPFDLPTPSNDIDRAAWVMDELGPWTTIKGVLPPRFARYARVFHPAYGQDLVWAGDQVTGKFEQSLRWKDVATRQQSNFHPLAQWSNIAASYSQPPRGQDGWQLSPPRLGRIDLTDLAAIASVLQRHTNTPENSFATLWEGHGELDEFGSPDSLALETKTFRRVPFPGRNSLLFELDVRSLMMPSWASESGWDNGYGDPLTPQMMWPADRAWFLSSEIDYDSTLIGGSAELLSDLISLGQRGVIEVLEVPEDADLTSTGDAINPPSPPVTG